MLLMLIIKLSITYSIKYKKRVAGIIVMSIEIGLVIWGGLELYGKNCVMNWNIIYYGK